MSQLTKKLWNELTNDSKSAIIVTLGYSINTYKNHWLINNEYKHDFNYDEYGRALKEILSHCRLQDDGTIDIVRTVTPTFKAKVSRPVISTPKPTLTRYIVDYDYPVNGGEDRDLNHEWYDAYSEQEVRREFESEHSSECTIIQIRKSRD